MSLVRKRKRDMVEAQVTAHLQNYRDSGAELIMGSARFVAPKTIEVSLNDSGTRVLVGEKIFVNVGTHAAIPDVPGLKAAKPLTHIEALELDYLPQHLIVIGGGYVGLELAQAYRRFGSRVTVVEQGPQLMGREDRDIAEEIQRILSGEGSEFFLAAKVIEVRGQSGENVSIVVRMDPASGQSKGVTFSSQRGACRTRAASGSNRPTSRWTITAIFASTSDWRRARQGCGPSANALEARNSPTYRRTTFGSSGII